MSFKKCFAEAMRNFNLFRPDSSKFASIKSAPTDGVIPRGLLRGGFIWGIYMDFLILSVALGCTSPAAPEGGNR